MEFPDSIGQLGQNLQSFMMMNGASLPEFTRAKLIEVIGSPSPVDRIVKSAEALYAVADQLNDDGKTICAQLASFAAMNSWHGMSIDNRGGRMAQAMMRELGETAPVGSWPDPETDPEAAPEYVEPPATDAPVVP